MPLRRIIPRAAISRACRIPWTVLLGAVLVAGFAFAPAAPMDAQRRALLDHAEAERTRAASVPSSSLLFNDVPSRVRRSGDALQPWKPSNLVSGDDFLFFTALGERGTELWRSDGTTEGTTVVADVRPGYAGSDPSDLRFIDGVLYFSADDGVHGRELWRTDGTATGTRLVADINPGAASSSPSGMTGLGDVIVFSADDGVHGLEPWRTDGTPNGTQLVRDINPGAEASAPADLVAAAGVMYFVADDGATGRELWRTDGTAAGTSLTRNIAAGAADANPRELTALGDALVFTADDRRLWRSEGTTETTVVVNDLDRFTNTEQPRTFTVLNDEVYFVVGDAALWRTDGTPLGTSVVRREKAPERIGDLEVMGGALYVARGYEYTNELWRTDGSATLQFAASVYIYSQMIAIGGTLYFAGYDQELWASDGTQKGTTQVADINQQKDCWPVPYGEERCRDIGSYPNQFVGLHGRVYFFATSGYWEPTQELWTSDGTMEGTTLVAYKEFTGHPDLEPADLTAASGRLLLTGEVISDTTTPEFRTLLVVDPAQDASQPATRVTSAGASIVVESHLHRMGDAVYFLGTRSGGRVGLWRMDPTATEPTLVKDDLAAPGGYAAQYIADADGTLFLRGRDATHGTELWRSDGIEAGTRLVADINPGTADADIGGADGRVYTSLGNLFIFAATSEAGVQLWRSDGTLAGTFALPGSVAPTSLAQVGDAVYVAATDATTGAPALWRTDGTVEGTALVQAFPSGTVLRELTAFGDTVIFTSVRASAYAVWTSDGTPTGTRELNSYRLPVQGGTVPLQYYAVIDKRVFFAAGDAGDTELWRSDGTHDGTQRYLDINAGVAPSEPRNITNIGGRLMFSADNGVGVGYRHEVWLVDDVDPNHQQTFYFVQGDASGFLRTGRFVYFVAHDYQYGRELWRASFRFDPQATLMLPSVAR